MRQLLRAGQASVIAVLSCRCIVRVSDGKVIVCASTCKQHVQDPYFRIDTPLGKRVLDERGRVSYE